MYRSLSFSLSLSSFIISSYLAYNSSNDIYVFGAVSISKLGSIIFNFSLIDFKGFFIGAVNFSTSSYA